MSSQFPPGCSAYGGRGPLVLGLTWTWFTIATVFICLRLYTRLKIVPHAGWALIWAVGCWVFSTATQVLLTLAVKNGLGNHIDAVFECGNYVSVAMWSILSGSLALVPIGLSKTAVVAFLLAIIGPTRRYQKCFLIFLAVSNILLNIMQMLRTMFRCNPPEKAWNPAIAGSCHNAESWSVDTSYLVGVWNVLSDFILALYPIVLLYKIQMDRKVKIGVCFLMGLGCVAGVCGIMRTVLIPLAYTSNDPTYEAGSEVIWVWTEMWLVLIVSSIPPLYPLIKRTFRSLRSTVQSSRNVRLQSHSPQASAVSRQGPLPSGIQPKPPETGFTKVEDSRSDSSLSAATFATAEKLPDEEHGELRAPSVGLGPWREGQWRCRSWIEPINKFRTSRTSRTDS